MKYFSLFSGIGGFELGIQQAYEDKKNRKYLQKQRTGRTSNKSGRSKSEFDSSKERGKSGNADCVGFSEIDKYAIQIYERHFNHKSYGDITKINVQRLPDFDLLVGGFPCQSFSIAGKRGGFEDTRGTLFFEIARIARAKRPRYLFLENVKGLLSHDEGNTFATIISTIDELGYDCQWQVLNSKNFGVPQNRERVFIVGHLRGISRPKVFPIGESSKEIDNRELEKPGLMPINFKHFAGDGMGTRRRKRVNISTSLASHPGLNGAMLIEKPQIRRLTPTECERLQGFPDSWTEGVSDTQRYKVLGNAVSVPVIKAIAKRLLK